MKNNIKIFGIQKLQRGNIINKQYSGTWGNRGQGNELQSALETGATWVADKIINAGDYIDDTVSYLVGLIPEENILQTKWSKIIDVLVKQVVGRYSR